MDDRRPWHGTPKKEFHTEITKIAKGDLQFTGWRGVWLNGRSTPLAWHVEEEFHTEITKIAKRDLQFTGWRGVWLNGRSTPMAWHAEEKFHTEFTKIAKGDLQFTGWRGVWLNDDRRPWHGTPKKNFTQRSQRSQRGISNSPVGGAFG